MTVALMQKRPLLVVLLGPSGSGKSTLGALLAQHLPGSKLLDTDTVPVPGRGDGFDVRTEQDRYELYRSMQSAAREVLAANRDAIWCQALTMEAADPSHPPPAGRLGLVSLADSTNAGIAMLHCVTPVPVLKERLRQRRRPTRTGVPWSDVLQRMLASWEPIRHSHLRVNTSGPVDMPLVPQYLEERRTIG